MGQFYSLIHSKLVKLYYIHDMYRKLSKPNSEVIKDRNGRGVYSSITKFGMLLPSWLENDRLNSLTGFTARADDIWLCSYPKSGIHWLHEIVSMLKANSGDIIKPSVIRDSCLEQKTNEELETLPSPRILVSHLPVNLIPEDVWEMKSRVIYLYRNPKDIAVSAYNMHKNVAISIFQYGGNFSDFLGTHLYQTKAYGGWYNHVTQWWASHRDNSNVTFLSYEDMNKSHLSKIQDIAEFLNCTCSAETMEDIRRNTTLEYMRANKQVDPAGCGLKFFHKGQVGGWKFYFDADDNAQFDVYFKEQMKNCDLLSHIEFGDCQQVSDW